MKIVAAERIEITLPSGDTIYIDSAKDLISLFNSLVDELKESNLTIGRIGRMEIVIKVCRMHNITFSDIFPKNRFATIVNATPSNIKPFEIDPFVRAIEYICAELGKTSLSLGSTNTRTDNVAAGGARTFVKHTGYWTKVLGLEPGNANQDRLDDIAGSYILFRPIFQRSSCIVSHMIVDKPHRKGEVTTFMTVGLPDSPDETDIEVAGIIFVPENEENAFISIGKYRRRVKVRCAILESVRKPASDQKNHAGLDLRGIRLALGTVIRGAVAHRIWCSRIPPELDRAYWGTRLGERPARTLEEDYPEIVGIAEIKRWLLEKSVLSTNRAADEGTA